MILAPADTEDGISALTARFKEQSLEGQKLPEIKAFGVLLLQFWLEQTIAGLSSQCPGFFENGTVTKTGQLNLRHSLDTGHRPFCTFPRGTATPMQNR